MGLILGSFFKSLGQFDDPVFRRALITGILTAAAVLWGFAIVVSYGISALTSGFSLPIVGELPQVSWALGWGSFFAILGLSVFLMVPVASAISSLFTDQVARAVEHRHYPHLGDVEPQSLGDTIRDTFSFLGNLIAANLFALILYVFFAPLAPFIFWGLNGYLLGREYFQMAATRRIGRTAAKQIWRQNRLTLWVAGILMAMPLSIPLINLVIPIIGTATFTHLFQRLAQGGYNDRNNQYRRS